MSDEYITAKEARTILGVSKMKIAQLIAKGILPVSENPLDNRQKLIRRSDVEKLMRKTVE